MYNHYTADCSEFEQNISTNVKFVRVDKLKIACPICNSRDWCMVSENYVSSSFVEGFVRCNRDSLLSKSITGFRFVNESEAAIKGYSLWAVDRPYNPEKAKSKKGRTKVKKEPTKVELPQVLPTTESIACSEESLKSLSQTFPKSVFKDIPAEHSYKSLKEKLETLGVLESAEIKCFVFSYSDQQKIKRYDASYRQNDELSKFKTFWTVNPSKERMPSYGIDDLPCDREKLVVLVEGERCVDCLRYLGIYAITFSGGSWSDTSIKHNLEAIKDKIHGIVMIPDYDKAGQEKLKRVSSVARDLQIPFCSVSMKALLPELPDEVPKASGLDIIDWYTKRKKEGVTDRMEQHSLLLEILRRQIKEYKGEPLEYMDTEFLPETIKVAPDIADVADIVDELNTAEAEPKVFFNIKKLQEWKTRKYSENGVTIHLSKLTAVDWASLFATKYKHYYQYRDTKAAFYFFNGKFWEVVKPTEMQRRVSVFIKKEVNPLGFLYEKPSLPDGVITELSRIFYLKDKDLDEKDKNLINFSNGVLNFDTLEFLPHSPSFNFTDCLDRDYVPMKHTGDLISMLKQSCPKIYSWLNFAFDGDYNTILKVIAAINGVIRKRFSSWQKFLFLKGVPGSGKSTFIKILEALIGKKNSFAGSLTDLDSEYTMAEIIDKVFVGFSDEDSVTNAKTIAKLCTGDGLRYRSIYKQPGTAAFKGTVVIAANQMIFKGCVGGLFRRTVLLDFKKPIVNPDFNFESKIKDELTYLTSIALLMPEEEASTRTSEINKAETLLSTYDADPIMGFIYEKIIFDPKAKTFIGSSKMENSEQRLFPSFDKWATETNHTNKITLNNFSKRFLEGILSQIPEDLIKHCGVKLSRCSQGKFIVGVRLKQDGEISTMESYEQVRNEGTVDNQETAIAEPTELDISNCPEDVKAIAGKLIEKDETLTEEQYSKNKEIVQSLNIGDRILFWNNPDKRMMLGTVVSKDSEKYFYVSYPGAKDEYTIAYYALRLSLPAKNERA